MNLMRPGEFFIKVLFCAQHRIAFRVLKHGLLSQFQRIVVRLGEIDFKGRFATTLINSTLPEIK